MSLAINNIIMRNTVFAWIVLATALVLLVPLFAMQFSSEVNWGTADFIIMGSLLLGTGSLFVLVARKVPRKHRFVIGVLCALALVYIWAELALGAFTNLGS